MYYTPLPPPGEGGRTGKLFGSKMSAKDIPTVRVQEQRHGLQRYKPLNLIHEQSPLTNFALSA